MCADTDDPGEMIWPDTGCLTRCVVCDGNEWIEVYKIGVERAVPHALASSASGHVETPAQVSMPGSHQSPEGL
jgi:hypothetical protein